MIDKNGKIYIYSQSESKLVQDVMFGLGYYWAAGKKYKYLDARYLAWGSYNRLLYGTSRSGFEANNKKEYTIEDFKMKRRYYDDK